jgi:uncharacterized protein YciW
VFFAFFREQFPVVYAVAEMILSRDVVKNLKIAKISKFSKKERMSLATENKSKITKAIRKNNEYRNKQRIAIINQL